MNKNQSKALYYVRITGVLLVITMCTAFLLAFVNGVTKDRIAENELKKTNEAVSSVFTTAADIKTEDLGITLEDVEVFCKVLDGDTHIGYYATVTPIGFKGDVKMLVGLDTEGKVLGIKILSHSETVGIGDKAFTDGYLGEFNGVGESEALPDAISGATYSSNAVRNGAILAYEAYKTAKGGAN